MPDIEFAYKGKHIVIREEHPGAVVSVDGREFRCNHHHQEEGQGLTMWMCDEAYFASPDIRELARHFADYGYLFDAPGRVVVDEAGEVVRVGPKKPDEEPGGQGHHGGEHEGEGHEGEGHEGGNGGH